MSVPRIPVLLGTYTVNEKVGTAEEVQINKDAISRVTQGVATALGMTQVDPALLAGSTQEGNTRDFRFPAQGSLTGRKCQVTMSTTTPGGNPKTHSFPIPADFPLYVLDDFIFGLTPAEGTIRSFKVGKGRSIVPGSTRVTT